MTIRHCCFHASIVVILFESMSEDDEDHQGNKDGDERSKGSDDDANNVRALSLGFRGLLRF